MPQKHDKYGFIVSWNSNLEDDGGALYGINATTKCANATGLDGVFSKGFGIDASRSSSVYKDNTYVQQAATVVNFCIRY